MAYREGNELFDKLMYIAWMIDRDGTLEELNYCSNLEAWETTKKYADVHCGDCIKMASSCVRCMVQKYEIEAENLYLFLKPHLKEEEKCQTTKND